MKRAWGIRNAAVSGRLTREYATKIYNLIIIVSAREKSKIQRNKSTLFLNGTLYRDKHTSEASQITGGSAANQPYRLSDVTTFTVPC